MVLWPHFLCWSHILSNQELVECFSNMLYLLSFRRGGYGNSYAGRQAIGFPAHQQLLISPVLLSLSRWHFAISQWRDIRRLSLLCLVCCVPPESQHQNLVMSGSVFVLSKWSELNTLNTAEFSTVSSQTAPSTLFGLLTSDFDFGSFYNQSIILMQLEVSFLSNALQGCPNTAFSLVL